METSEEVAKLPVTSRAQSRRLTKKLEALVYYTKINGKNNGSTEYATVSVEDEQDGIDSEHQYALLMDLIGGDALAYIACIAGIKNVLDYPKAMYQ